MYQPKSVYIHFTQLKCCEDSQTSRECLQDPEVGGTAACVSVLYIKTRVFLHSRVILHNTLQEGQREAKRKQGTRSWKSAEDTKRIFDIRNTVIISATLSFTIFMNRTEERKSRVFMRKKQRTRMISIFCTIFSDFIANIRKFISCMMTTN